jgi:hypothetical protein
LKAIIIIYGQSTFTLSISSSKHSTRHHLQQQHDKGVVIGHGGAEGIYIHPYAIFIGCFVFVSKSSFYSDEKELKMMAPLGIFGVADHEFDIRLLSRLGDNSCLNFYQTFCM